MLLCCSQQPSRSFGYCEKLKHKKLKGTGPHTTHISKLSPWAVLAIGGVVRRHPGLVAHGRWNLSGCVGRVELVLGYSALGFRCEPHALTVPLERRCIIKEKAFRRNPGYVTIHSHRNKTRARTKIGKM